MKYESLYNNGLQPLIKPFSRPWQRGGSNIAYSKNTIPRANPNRDPKVPTNYYTLTFVYTFDKQGEEVFFAHCYPYTYSDLVGFIGKLEGNPLNSQYLRVDTLCQTLAGNDCPLLTITDRVKSYTPWSEEESIMLKSAAGRKFMRQRASKIEKPSGKSPSS